MFIINIIEREPEYNFEVIEKLEKYTDPEIFNARSQTGILNLSRIKALPEKEKMILMRFIKQVAPYFGLNVNEGHKSDIL